jgi:hypothetical protein
MELYSGAKMVNEKYLKTKNVRSKNREFTVYLVGPLIEHICYQDLPNHGHQFIICVSTKVVINILVHCFDKH